MKKPVLVVLSIFLAASAARPASAESVEAAIRASYLAEAGRNPAAAIQALKSVENSEGQSYFYNLRMGWLFYLVGKWGESANFYAAAVDLEPAAVEPLQGLLLPLTAAGKSAELIQTHERILKNDPHNYKSLSQLAWIHYQAKQYKLAAKYYTAILRLYPTDVEMMLGLGYSLKLEGNKEGADKTFHQVLLLSPQNTRALAGLKAA